MAGPEFLSLDADAGSGAAALAPLTWYPGERADMPVVLVVPALGTPAGVYRRLAESLMAQGLQAAVVELRGVGRSPVRARRGVDWGYADLVDGEIAHAVQALRAHCPQAPIFGLGHSLGGHALLLHQARRIDQPLAGVALVASGTPWWRNYRGGARWMVRLLGLAADRSSRWCGYYPGDWLRFGGRQGARLMREWAHLVGHGSFAESIWPDGGWRDALRGLRTPVLGIAMPGDAYTPFESLKHLLHIVGHAEAGEMLEVDGRPGHFGWLKQPAPLAGRVARWMRG